MKFKPGDKVVRRKKICDKLSALPYCTVASVHGTGSLSIVAPNGEAVTTENGYYASYWNSENFELFNNSKRKFTYKRGGGV